jgi:hypothetical protein
MSAQEMPKINCISGMVLYGSVGYVAQAGGMSTLSLNCAFSFENTPQVNAIAVGAKKSLILASQASWSELSLVKSISAPTARLTGPRPCQEPRFLVGKLSRQMTGRWGTGRCACRPFSLVRRSTSYNRIIRLDPNVAEPLKTETGGHLVTNGAEVPTARWCYPGAP